MSQAAMAVHLDKTGALYLSCPQESMATAITIQDVWTRHREDLRRVEEQMTGFLSTRVPLIGQVGGYILQGGGKRLRPLLVVLSARLCGHNGPAAVLLGSVVEFIHTASLLHDDVVDEASVRRGRAVAHTIWGNPASILVGDYLYSKALLLAVGLKNQRVMDTLAEATTTMSEGEVMELLRVADLGLSEEDYFKIVDAKTAALISASCRLGAILGGAGGEQEEALAAFGRKIGLAFQLADDVLDYMADSEKFGKALGKDIMEGKVTLPLIHLVAHSSPEEAAAVKALFDDPDSAQGRLSSVGTRMQRHGSMDYVLEKARRSVAEAKEALAVFPPSETREELGAVAEYVIGREW